MKTLEEIEVAIAQLPPDNLHRLIFRLQKYDDSWDCQMRDDAAAGKLDRIIGRAEANIAAGRVRSLDAVLDGT